MPKKNNLKKKKQKIENFDRNAAFEYDLIKNTE